MLEHGPIHGAGLGLRRALLGPLADQPASIDFLEVTPENWIGVGGGLGRRFCALTEGYPLAAHGLSLSLGGPDPLDGEYLARLRRFLDEHHIRCFSEHLSYCSDGGHLYDLMPLPFTEQAVAHTAARIRRVQEALGRRIAVENVSYYARPAGEMDEAAFITTVVTEADCELLLDVNNAYVNGANHGYDPLAFIRGLPLERVAYLHVAGHHREADDLIIDTHGAEVIDPVWQLLDEVYGLLGPVPTLLERDFNLPPRDELLVEVGTIAVLQGKWRRANERRAATC